MTDASKHHVRVGVFALSAIGLVLVVLVVFGGIRFWAGRDRYYLEFDNVMGLEEGAQVYFNGIQVGSVGDIKLAPDDPGKVRVRLDLDPGTPIRQDTRGELSMAGITGLKVIDLHGGRGDSPKLAEDSVIPTSKGTLDKLQAQAEDIVDRTKKVLEHADKVVDNANRVVDNLAQITDPRPFRDTLAHLSSAAASLDTLVADNRTALHDTLASVHDTSEQAKGFVVDLRAAVKTDQASITAMLADLRQGARSLKELAREVRDKPSRMLFSNSAPDRRLPK